MGFRVWDLGFRPQTRTPNPQVCVSEQRADGLLDNRFNDVDGRVKHSTRFFDLRLFLDLGMVAGGQADNLAQKLLVHTAQDVGAQHAELVGAVRVVQAGQNLLERSVVKLHDWGQAIAVGGGVEIEQARIVCGVGLAIELDQAGVDTGLLGQLEQAAIRLDLAILGHAQKDNPVNSPLHGKIHVVNREAGVVHGDVFSQDLAPALDLFQKLGINWAEAPFQPCRLDKLVQTACLYRLLAEQVV